LNTSRKTIRKLLSDEDLNYEAKKRPKSCPHKINDILEQAIVAYHKKFGYGAALMKVNFDIKCSVITLYIGYNNPIRKQFYISLKALIRNDGKILLLTKEIGSETYWDLPGGGIEDFDTFETTLIREITEEVEGVTIINIIGQIASCWELDRKFVRDDNRQLVIFYLVDADVSNIQLSKEHSSYKWVAANNLDEILKSKNPILLEGYKNALIKAFS
jgi:8-oxo-dGTP pyrophosphatase MutT (NUDIX family)